MQKTYVSIDNGVTGSIAILSEDDVEFIKTPTISQTNYTKSKKQNITRLNVMEFMRILSNCDRDNTIVLVERPFVNPKMFMTSLCSIRCFEATIVCLEALELPYEYIDSKTWQKEMLPKGCKKSVELKKASLDVGIRLFPGWKKEIIKQKDADSLLMAEWARRRNL
jgi:hypothetical protein